MNTRTEQLIITFRREVVRPLARLGSAIRRQILADGLCISFCVLIALCTGQFVLDRLLVLEIGPRSALTILVIGIMAQQVRRRVLWAAGLRIGVDDVAAAIERRLPRQSDRIVSAVAFASGSMVNPLRDSPRLMESLIADVLAEFDRSCTEGLLRRDVFWRRIALAFAAAGCAAAFALLSPLVASTYLQRNWLFRDTAWPVSTRIAAEGFTDGRLRWPIGDDLKIKARALDGDPSGLYAELEYPSGEFVERDMDRLGTNQFILDYGPLVQAMRLRFVIARFGVDERTTWYEVDAVERPSVSSVRMEVTPPAYAMQPAFVPAAGQTSVDLIRGSRVMIAAEMNKPIATAKLRYRADESVALDTSVKARHLESEFTPERKGAYYFDVRDADGLEDRSPVSYVLNLLTDPPPKVRLTLSGVGEMVVPTAQLRLGIECEDNLGLEKSELMYERRTGAADGGGENGGTDGKGFRSEPLPGFTPRQEKFGVEYLWPLLPLTLKPGDRLTLFVEATDYQPATATSTDANVGRSVSYGLRIVSPEELLAEMGRRENEWRREFEQIIKAQEQINRRVKELRGVTGASAMSNSQSAGYGQESRNQRQQVSRVRTVMRQFQHILDELETNELATPPVRRRLQGGVLNPLRSLIGSDITAAADRLDRLRNEYSDSVADEVDTAQTELLRAMRAILADMLKWEGYNEAVALMRDVVRLQQDVNEDTRKQLDREIERLFGGETSPTSQPVREESP